VRNNSNNTEKKIGIYRTCHEDIEYKNYYAGKNPRKETELMTEEL